MKTIILSTIAILSSAAFAAPAPQATTTTAAPVSTDIVGPFGLMSVRSGSSLQYATINAADSKFWIGKSTETYCPTGIEGLDCSRLNSNTTQLQFYGDGLSMYTNVPGGMFPCPFFSSFSFFLL
jgi:hypothetical protein